MIKENEFIKQNKTHWSKFELLLGKNSLVFDETREFGILYQIVVENLSYSQTYLNDRNITRYLTLLVVKAHQRMQKQKRPGFKKIIDFFTTIFPLKLVKLKYSILLCAAVFIMTILISFLMVYTNPEFAEIFLHPSVYEQTMQDLELRKEFSNFDNIPPESRVNTAFKIWINNSRVSLLAFALGATFGIGTLFVIMSNGFMLGSLLAVYFLNGHFIDFFSIIMVHGSIELAAIVFAGGAGLHIAGAFFFPGRMPRIERLKKNAGDSFILLIGIIILLLFAGIIEGLITTLKPGIIYRLIIAGTNIFLLSAYYIYGFIINYNIKKLKNMN